MAKIAKKPLRVPIRSYVIPVGATVRDIEDGKFGVIEKIGSKFGMEGGSYRAYWVRWGDGNLGYPNEYDLEEVDGEGYSPYAKPKTGLFSIETDDYRLPGGWVRKVVKAVIIGETRDLYVTELRRTGHPECVDGKFTEYHYLLPLGYHHSRLVQWVLDDRHADSLIDLL